MLLLAAGHGLLPAPLLARPPVPATSRLSVLMSVAPPVTELLLQSKRPIGRRQLGYKATRWLKREMEACANDYLRGVSEADPMRPQEVLTARALAMSYSPEGLEERLHDQLHICMTEDCDPDQTSAAVFVGNLADDIPLIYQLEEADRAAHEVAASHQPTVWAAFQLAVQTKLQKQNGGGEAGDELAWKETAAWRVFLHLQADVQSKQSKPKPSKSAKGPKSRKAGKGGKQQQQQSDAPLTLETPLTAVKASKADTSAVASARAKDAARRASLVRSKKLPYGKRELGPLMNLWLMGASAGCADAYCVAVERVRDSQVSDLIDLLGSGDTGTSAVITALNTEVVSAETVDRAAELLFDAEAFAKFDLDGDGFMTLEELRTVLLRPGGGLPMTDEQIQKLFKQMDGDGNGKVDLVEFSKALTTGLIEEPAAADLALDVDEEAMDEQEEEATEGEAGAAEATAAAGGGASGSSVGDEFGKLHYERMLMELRPHFGVVATATRYNEILDKCGPPPRLGELAPAGLEVRNHVPTLWSYFSRAVRKRLEAKLGRERWSECAEWKVLQALYAEASASKATAWQLNKATRHAPHQQLVGRWQRSGPVDAKERQRRRGKKLRPVGTWTPEGGRGGGGPEGGSEAGAGAGAAPAFDGKVTPSRAGARSPAPRAEGLPQRA